ncbi:MAG: hypothetical protein IT381_02905 [Deltaproteobacteria bacterium]|nr:hypothetical protein [Deltaproteobacteria bacterium]
MSVNLRSVPQGPGGQTLPPEGEGVAQTDTADRVQAKSAKQAESEKGVEERREKKIGGGNKEVDGVNKSKAIDQARALIEALAKSGVIAEGTLSEAGRNEALALFEAFLPKLGKPTGALAGDFSTRDDVAPLRAIPEALIHEEAWRDLAEVAAKLLSGSGASLGANQKAVNLDATLTALLKKLDSSDGERTLDPAAVKQMPAQWVKYAKIVEAFWKHDKSALLETPQPTPQQVAALAAMKPHLEALAAVWKSSYTPAIKKAQTANAPSDVPEIPDATVTAIEEAMGGRSLSEVGVRVAAMLQDGKQGPELKQALRAVADGKAPQGSSGVITLAKAAVSHVQAFSGFNAETGDIDTLVWMVMMESAKVEEAIMRDQMKEMQKQNNLKKAQREKLSILREGEARMNAQMAEEYHHLQSQGKVHPTISLDQYKTWRKVAWGDGQINEDGTFTGPRPTLPQPPPPIPEWIKNGTTPQVQGGGGTAGNKYGLEQDVAKRLEEIYNALPKDGKPPKPLSFDAWLSGTLGLEEPKGTGKAYVDAAIRNLEKAQAALSDRGKLGAVNETKGPDGPVLTLQQVIDKAAEFYLMEMLNGLSGVSPKLSEVELAKRRAEVDKALSNMSKEDKAAFNAGGYGKAAIADKVKKLGQSLQGELEALQRKMASKYNPTGGSINGGEHEVGNWREFLKIFPGGAHFWTQREGKGLNGRDDWGWNDYNNFSGRSEFFSPGGVIGAVMTMLGGSTLQGERGTGKGGWGELVDKMKEFGSGAVNFAVPADPEGPSAKDLEDLIASGMTEAKKEIAKALKAYREIQSMSRNPDGSYYGTPTEETQEYFDALIAAGKIKKGKSPDEMRAEQAEKDKQEKEYLDGLKSGDGKVSSYALRLNQSGTISELNAAVETAKTTLDTMGDMSAIESMRMQQMMERRSKALEMLSNIMKKMAQVSDSIVANYK